VHQRSGKAPTIKDIAVEAGVSKSAVSRALRGEPDVSDETRQRVQAAAATLGYVANAMARGLVSARTGTLGVVLRDITRPFYAELYAAMQARAERSGYRIVTSTSAGELEVADAIGALRSLVSLQVDGVIIATAQLDSEHLLPYSERTPIVVAGRMEANDAVPAVYCDDQDGGTALAEHLLGLGHRKVAVGLVDSAYSLSQHRRGVAMIGRLHEDGAEVVAIPLPNDRELDALFEASAGVTAVMCPTDAAMLLMLEYARTSGRPVPAELSLTGYDGLGPFATPFLGLTTYRQPVEEIGARAVEMLLDEIDGRPTEQRHIALRGSIIAGRTTAAR